MSDDLVKRLQKNRSWEPHEAANRIIEQADRIAELEAALREQKDQASEDIIWMSHKVTIAVLLPVTLIVLLIWGAAVLWGTVVFEVLLALVTVAFIYWMTFDFVRIYLRRRGRHE